MQPHHPALQATSRRSVPAILPAFAVFVSVLLAGCGQTGAPLPPSLDLPVPVADLAASRVADRVILRWTMPRRTTDKLLLQGPQSVHVCRRVENGPCAGVADLLFVPDKPAGYEDVLPAELVTGSPRPLNYTVEVRNRRGRSAGDSNIARTVAGAPPAPFTEVRAEVRADGVHLHWQPATLTGDRNKVSIHRTLLTLPAATRPESGSKSPLSGPTPLVRDQTLVVRLPAGPDTGEALDPDAAFDQRYSYRISRVQTLTIAGKSVDIGGSESQAFVVDTKDAFPPQPPTGLAAVSAPHEGAIDLSWSPNTETDLAGYAVYRSQAGGRPQKISPPEKPLATPDFRDLTAQPGRQYSYSVSAIDRDGNESPRSAETTESLPPK